MKCTQCHQEKEESEFYYRDRVKGLRRSNCKVCCEERRDSSKYYYMHHEKYKANTRARNDKARKRVQEFVLSYLIENPCTVCGEKDPVVLEFHHRDPSEKEYNVSQLTKNGWKFDKLKIEMSKCDVLCANCHKRETAKQRGSYKLMNVFPQ